MRTRIDDGGGLWVDGWQCWTTIRWIHDAEDTMNVVLVKDQNATSSTSWLTTFVVVVKKRCKRYDTEDARQTIISDLRAKKVPDSVIFNRCKGEAYKREPEWQEQDLFELVG